MQPAIETRELISERVNECELWGTYHRIPSSYASPAIEPNRVGILFINSLFVPRASCGNVAVEWTDSFAQHGYPSFRFDLPGLGDSNGEIPQKAQDLAFLVSNGLYASSVSGLAEQLTTRFNLRGMVLMGHCAGAISTVYGAASSKQVKGLVALDPTFFRYPPEDAEFGQQMRRWAKHSIVRREIGKIYRGLQKLRVSLKTDALPQNSNVRMIRCWRQLAANGMPMLILKARMPTSRTWEFDYCSHLQKTSGSKSRIDVRLIDGTNHDFSNGTGRTAARVHIENWMHTYFPLLPRDQASYSNA